MVLVCVSTELARGNELATAASAEVEKFQSEIRPLLEQYCFHCHGEDTQEASVRLDTLDPNMVTGPDAEKWHAALDMINSASMPPDYDSQPEDDERRKMVEWMTASIDLATKARQQQAGTTLRRLTKAQYSRSLADLLGVPIDFGRNLPDEAKSKMGFTASESALSTSSLHVEYFESIARQALDRAVPTGERPGSHHYRVTIGTNVGQGRHAAMIDGFQTAPIHRDHLRVEILDDTGNVRTASTPEEEAALRAIEENVGICMRGSSSDRYRVVDDGLLMFSALPHKEEAPQSWQGPSPHMGLLLRRCFPESGPFALRVAASRARYADCNPVDGLTSLRSKETSVTLAEPNSEPTIAANATTLLASKCEQQEEMRREGDLLVPVDITKTSKAKFEFELAHEGYYQIDLVHPIAAADAMPSVSLSVDASDQHLRLSPEGWPTSGRVVTPLAHAKLSPGKHRLEVGGRFFVGFSHVALTPLAADHPTSVALANELKQNAANFQGEEASLRAFLGNRTDDGMEYEEFDTPRVVSAGPEKPEVFEFHGELENLPAPVMDETELTDLANIMVVGVWNDALVKRAADCGVPIVVRSIEFHGPHFPEWPPASHRQVFFDSPKKDQDLDGYTREVFERFMTRAFRRVVTNKEVDRYFQFWQSIRGDHADYHQGVKEVLVAVLCSPSFLYVSPTATPETVDAALAERLAYFLWNAPPDERLSTLASKGNLSAELSGEVERMIADPRVDGMIETFADEWLRLDRHQSMSVNIHKYPDYTRFVRRDMRLETLHFLKHVLQQDLSVLTMIDSDFAMLNQNLAEFYGITGVEGSEFRPVPVTAELHRGGLLSQGAFLTGHSDGTQAHPIKRAVWLRSKILGSTPPPPPPNVPELDPETPGFEKLTLKEQLELHRSKASCVDCHAKIDPWGVVFENYDAVGRFQQQAKGRPIDASTELPDGTAINGIDELKAYLLDKSRDEFVHSLASHLFAYALGRDVTFADQTELDTIVARTREGDYRFQTLITALVESPSFRGPIVDINSDTPETQE